MDTDGALRELILKLALEQTAVSGENVTLDADGGVGGADRKLRTQQSHIGCSSSVPSATLVHAGSSGAVHLGSATAEHAASANKHLLFLPMQRRNGTLACESLGSTIACQDVILDGNAPSPQRSYLWRTRPMVLHKVANPLHLYYLHWRLRHCAIPRKELLTPPALANSLNEIPSTKDIFHTKYSMFAHGGHAKLIVT
jgi:hypothetical protein